MEFLLDAKGWEHAAAVLCLEVTFERGLSPQKFLKGKWLGTLFSDEVSEGQSHHSNLRFNYVTSQLKTHQPLPIIHSAPPPLFQDSALLPSHAGPWPLLYTFQAPSVNLCTGFSSSHKALCSPSAGWLLHILKTSA